MIKFYDEEEILRSYIQSERYEAAQEAAKEATVKATLENQKETAIRLIEMDMMSLDNIAKATKLPIDVVKELKTEATQLA